MANALGAIKRHSYSSSDYAKLGLPGGKFVEVRISNHNANAGNFAERGHTEGNISIVIKSRRTSNSFKAHPNVELTEYVYTTEAIKADSNMLSQVAESLRRMIDTGEYVDLSGKAIVNRSPEVGLDSPDALVEERRGRYGRLAKAEASTRSLFDVAEQEDGDPVKAATANESIDRFSEDYMRYLVESERLETQLEMLSPQSEAYSEARELLDQLEAETADAMQRLEDGLADYYNQGEQSPEDARRAARDMAGRVRAEIEIRRRQLELRRSPGEVTEGAGDRTVNPEDAFMAGSEGSENVRSASPKVRLASGDIVACRTMGRLPKLEDGEFAMMERQFSVSGEFRFDGSQKLGSVDDVAYLFRELESYAVEHTFAVLTGKDGARPVIVHLGMGTQTASPVDLTAIRAAFEEFGAEGIYFVHNHPSGVLRPSQADVNVLGRIRKMFDGQAKVEAVIMDATTGKYSVFTDGGVHTEMERPAVMAVDGGTQTAPVVLQFDRSVVFGERGDMDMTQIRSSEDVARFMSAQRLSGKGKIGFLVLSNSNEIIGDFHTTHESLTQTEALGDEMVRAVTRFGGRGAIVYGNMPLDGAQRLSDYVAGRGDIRMLDAVSVENGLRHSAMDNGLMREPSEPYGRGGSEVQEPALDKKEVERISDDIDQYEAEPSNEKEARAVELAGKLNTPIKLITSADEIGMLPTSRQRHAKGWITSDGEIVIVVPNNTDVADIENTVVHEIVGHDGLEAMIGPERMDEFVTEIYDHAGQGIKKKIDARADKEYSDDIDRMTRQKGGGVFAKAEATARANDKKRDGHYQREATKEYMADMAGEIGDKGFERMSQEEQTLWGKIKAKVQQFLDKFLHGLNIARSIQLKDKDLAYILYKAWKYKRENGVFAEAEDAVMRRKMGWGKKKPTWKETCTALTETGIKKPNGKTIAVPDSRSHAEAPRYVPSHSDSAKIQKISDKLQLLSEELPETGLGKNEILYELSSALGIGKAESGKSNYVIVNANGIESTIRLSNHSANTSNFGGTANNVGIVIKTRNHYFRDKADVDYVEFMYYGDKVEGNANRQRGIIDGLRHYIETGSFEKMPEADRLNTSGSYREAVEGLEDSILFRDGGLGLEEAITKMKADAMQADPNKLSKRLDFMKAIGENLSHIRQAMSWQKEYDIATAKSIKDLARILMEKGLLDTLGNAEVKSLLAQVTGSIGWDKTMLADGGNKKNTAKSEAGLNPIYPSSNGGQNVTGREARLNAITDPATNHTAKVIEKFEIATKS